jgi:hypothetical protein
MTCDWPSLRIVQRWVVTQGLWSTVEDLCEPGASVDARACQPLVVVVPRLEGVAPSLSRR